MQSPLLMILLLLIGTGIWLHNMRQHDRAVRAAHRICDDHDSQLLDHTVGLTGFKRYRYKGRLTLVRQYSFEVSVQGSDRQAGSLWLLRGYMIRYDAPWLEATTDGRPAPTPVTDLLERASRHRTR